MNENTATFLGVHVNTSLTWQDQVKHLRINYVKIYMLRYLAKGNLLCPAV